MNWLLNRYLATEANLRHCILRISRCKGSQRVGRDD